MKEITFEINSNEELWSLIDKNLNHILVHKFTPNLAIEWWATDIKMKDGELFKGLKVRNMEFDITTDLIGLKKLIELNTHQLRIYQFDKPIPGTLSLEHLPENNRDKILAQNGLKHIFFCNFEFLTVASLSDEFIAEIKNNEVFKDRIEERKKNLSE
ncbi:MAG: hypothetical protein EOO46_24100 [Flavobacterium sp.]|nr:MAG: hypothetical protein EOO46_24100 [Flavobacterium sp.]